MFPIGNIDNAYFHRNKGIISQNIGGIDFLENAKEDANKNLILLTPPLAEVVELETKGVLSKLCGVKDEDTKIKVPVSFDDNNNPKEFMEIWRGSASDRSLGYGNALAHVSFSTLNFEIEY